MTRSQAAPPWHHTSGISTTNTRPPPSGTTTNMCRSVLEQLGGALIGRRDARLVGLRLRKRRGIGPVLMASSACGCRLLLRAPYFLLLLLDHHHNRISAAARVLHLSSFEARLLASSMRSLLDSVCGVCGGFRWCGGGKKEMTSMNEVVRE